MSDSSEDPKPQPKPQQKPQSEPTVDEKPPWGEDFDPQRAWSLTQNLRGDKEKLQTQIADLQTQLDELKNKQLTDDERATKEAIEKAKADAEAAVKAELGPKYLASELKSIAAGVIRDQDQLKSFMAMVDPTKFVGDDGDIDEDKVMGHLTALYVGRDEPKRPPNWGQYSGTQAPEKPGSAGRAALEKRHGIQNSS